uniref:Mytimacin 6 n=1 Tax=Haliotis discus hannai TaxID=42344 RepID=A0A2R4LUX3_HALDH|nr:mytimacin 6 [Haliotis discus hannai]
MHTTDVHVAPRIKVLKPINMYKSHRFQLSSMPSLQFDIAFNSTMFLAIVVLAAVMVLPQVEGGCWETWSRCTGWSSWGTGRLWKSCNDRCKELGKSGGRCVLKDASDCWMTKKSYQCVCNRRK